MKKIVIIADRNGMINELSAWAKALFPECEISVVSARHENHWEHYSTKLESFEITGFLPSKE